jgi:hypothetical protein
VGGIRYTREKRTSLIGPKVDRSMPSCNATPHRQHSCSEAVHPSIRRKPISLETFTSRLYRSPIASRVISVGDFAVRYAPVLVIAWIGALKFTTYEANLIQPLVANGP